MHKLLNTFCVCLGEKGASTNIQNFVPEQGAFLVKKRNYSITWRGKIKIVATCLSTGDFLFTAEAEKQVESMILVVREVQDVFCVTGDVWCKTRWLLFTLCTLKDEGKTDGNWNKEKEHPLLKSVQRTERKPGAHEFSRSFSSVLSNKAAADVNV